MFCLLVVPVWLSIPVQVIDWTRLRNAFMAPLNPAHSFKASPGSEDMACSNDEENLHACARLFHDPIMTTCLTFVFRKSMTFAKIVISLRPKQLKEANIYRLNTGHRFADGFLIIRNLRYQKVYTHQKHMKHF